MRGRTARGGLGGRAATAHAGHDMRRPGPEEGTASGPGRSRAGRQLASTAENTHQASSDFAVRLRTMYAFSPNR